MEFVKTKDLVAGEVYIGKSGDEHKILAKWYNEIDKRWECMTQRTFPHGSQRVDKYWDNDNTTWVKKPKSLAQKFQLFRSAYGSGSGSQYWAGLEKIAREHYEEVINQSK